MKVAGQGLLAQAGCAASHTPDTECLVLVVLLPLSPMSFDIRGPRPSAVVVALSRHTNSTLSNCPGEGFISTTLPLGICWHMRRA